MSDHQRGRRKWVLVVILSLVAGALGWALTDSVMWFGVGVAFAVMFAVAATSPRDDR